MSKPSDSYLNPFLAKGLSRREFLQLTAASAAATALASALPNSRAQQAPNPNSFTEAPMLADKVSRGELPPVGERLPAKPRVVPPQGDIGQYGGVWHRAYTGLSDKSGTSKIIYAFGLHFFSPDPDTIEIVPGLFDEWTQNDDATEFTFHLREGLRWSDGKPFTTGDVQFWYDWFYQGELGQPYPDLTIDDTPMMLETVDMYTFKVSFPRPLPLLPNLIANDRTEGIQSGPTFGAPAHYLSQFIPELGDQALIDKALQENGLSVWQELFGTGGSGDGPIAYFFLNPELPLMGPWTLETPPPNNDPIVLVRNPYFYGVDPEGNQLPYIDRIEYAFFEDPNIFDLWVTQGRIDMQSRHTQVANFTLYKQNEDAGNYRVVVWRKAETNAFFPNTSHADPVLRDIFSTAKFREALSIAIDREEINELIYEGLFEPRQASPVTGSPEFDPEFEQRWVDYDPERAKALLDEMGLGIGGNGARLRPDGKPLSFFITHSQTGLQSHVDEINRVAKYWNDIGLNVNVDPVERSLYEERTSTGDIDVGWWENDKSVLIEADPRRYTGVINDGPWAPLYGDWYEGLPTGVEPPEGHGIRRIWELWNQASSEPDATKRHDLVMQMLAVHKEAPYAIGTVGEGPALVIVKNTFKNVPENMLSDTAMRDILMARPEQFYIDG